MPETIKRLGVYSIPKDSSKWGGYNGATGRNGLQPDFKQAVISALTEIVENYSPSLGYSDVQNTMLGDYGAYQKGLLIVDNARYAIRDRKTGKMVLREAWTSDYWGASSNAVGTDIKDYSAETWARYNVYIPNKELFANGLAWELKLYKQWTQYNENERYVTQTALPGSINIYDHMDILGNYGLQLVTVQSRVISGTDQYDSGPAGVFIRPINVEFDSDVDSLGYSGSVDYNGTSSEYFPTTDVIAYFYQNKFTSFQNSFEAESLTGNRALANDSPVWNDIQSLLNSSMRSIQTLPDGTFYAFYPDKWGISGKAPLLLPNEEILDMQVRFSEDRYASHVYCKPMGMDGKAVDYLYTMGVVSIVDLNNPSRTTPLDILNRLIYIPDDERYEYSPAALLKRYGARPYTCNGWNGAKALQAALGSAYESNPTTIIPFLCALYNFLEQWSAMFSVTVTCTYNPYIWPGMRLKIGDFDLTVYVESVTHSMDYSSGFTTTVSTSSPVGTLISGMVNVK